MRANSRGNKREYHGERRREPIRPVADEMVVQEQTIRDSGTGLTLEFESLSSGRFALHVSGGPLQGKRTFTFSENGLFESVESKGGTTPPSWHREVC